MEYWPPTPQTIESSGALPSGIWNRTRTTNDPVLMQGTPAPHPGSPSSSIDVASLDLTSSCVASASTIASHLCAERSNAAQPTGYGGGDSVTGAGDSVVSANCVT